jgi:ParB family chromosome partitioning protein
VADVYDTHEGSNHHSSQKTGTVKRNQGVPTPTSAIHAAGKLDDVPVDRIRPNPDNPRLTFRQGELEELQESIRRYGVKVPIAVFKRGSDFVLIDGERRWRCASKLNLKTIPALVQDEPDPLQNLLLMFNIHALREQWDLLTIALKLPKIIGLLASELGSQPTESELSEYTGLARGVIRRCRLLVDLPQKYQDLLLAELKKPKSKQEVGEDFFIEMEKSLKTVSRKMPGIVRNLNNARDALLAKYRSKVIKSNIEFRKVSKIARADAVGGDRVASEKAIKKLLVEPRYSINQAWLDTVSDAYAERDIVTRIDGLLSKLNEVTAADIDDEVRDKLEELAQRVKAILGEDA